VPLQVRINPTGNSSYTFQAEGIRYNTIAAGIAARNW
jgi:hypothetical protein